MILFPDYDWQWIVLDGPVDTLWIENLNTVLDETRTLCLANSERMALTNKIRVIFEVDSLFNATPSIVTRCAVVYMVSSQSPASDAHVLSRIATHPANHVSVPAEWPQ